MIIELFGPPCAGKTTLAGAIAARLRERGHSVRLVLSYRPSEDPLASGERIPSSRLAAPLRRVVRSVTESISAARQSAGDTEAAAVSELMRLLGPRNPVSSLRLRQYLVRLSRSWHEAALADDVALFDQAFVQAVSTAALTAGTADARLIGLALGAVPRPDLLLRLDAPRQILEARLAERRRRQGRIEQLFDARANLDTLAIFDQIEALLRTHGRPVTRVGSGDQHALDEIVSSAEREIIMVEGRRKSPPAAAGLAPACVGRRTDRARSAASSSEPPSHAGAER